MKQELSISAIVKRLLAFKYFAPFDNNAEDEYCTLLAGEYEAKVNPNSKKVSNFSHASLLELKEKIAEETETYTPWFKIALEKFLKHSYSQQQF